MSNKIDTIIFDIGGVLLPNYSEHIKNDISRSLEISREAVDLAFGELVPNFLGKGKISEEEFWQRFCELVGCIKEYDKSNLLTREMEKRYAPFSFVSDIVRSLKLADYKLGIISDTIKVHADCHKRHGLFDDFSVTILSHEVGFRKPDPKIFQLALEKLQSFPEKTVYIDDVPANVDAARNLGMQGIVFMNDNQLSVDLEKLGVEMEIVLEKKQTSVGAFALLMTNENKVLLQQKTNNYRTANPGKISMFGGGLSESEDLMHGLKRELLEELELLTDDYELEKLGVYQKNKEQDGMDDTIHVFVVRGVDEKKLKLHEGAAIISEKPEDVMTNEKVTRIARLALQDLIDKNNFIK